MHPDAGQRREPSDTVDFFSSHVWPGATARGGALRGIVQEGFSAGLTLKGFHERQQNAIHRGVRLVSS